MERLTKKFNLPISKQEVEIITYLTWGEKEKIQDVMISGAKIEDAQSGKVGFDTGAMLKSKYALFEVAVKNIGGKIYTRELMDNLPADDGDLIVKELENIQKKS